MVKRVVMLWCTFLFTATSGQAAVDHYWSAGPSLPVKVQEIYPAVNKSSIYVAGGLSESKNGIVVRDNVYQLDAKTGKWQTLPPLPEPRHHAMLVAEDNALWSFGGFITAGGGQWVNTDTVLRFDKATQSWEQKSPMPVALSETVAVMLNDKLHLIGGRTIKGRANGRWHDHNDTDWHGIYDATAGVWKTATPLPTPRNSACAVTYMGKIHVIGGRQVGGGNLDTHEMYDPTTARWKTLKPLPQKQAGLACVAYRHSIYVFGGEHFVDEGGVFSEVWRYDIARKKWGQISTMPVPRHGLGAVVLDDQIWLVGGATKAGAAGTSSVVSKLKNMN
ncbi:Kelch repeat-containing protein [Salinimonas chungwhensis]|uniref:Kelch repeat-containing protein n=1 Tax=Salinimonas chungwhensis TaxID=265425 RepID=UPI00037F742F|nr:kelch repeat-containing protein [Salinimonas chungwhensis]